MLQRDMVVSRESVKRKEVEKKVEWKGRIRVSVLEAKWCKREDL